MSEVMEGEGSELWDTAEMKNGIQWQIVFLADRERVESFVSEVDRYGA